jgi:O-antigen ligase
VSPSSTFVNQVLAFAGWALWLAMLLAWAPVLQSTAPPQPQQRRPPAPSHAPLAWLAAALGLLLLGMLWSGSPWGQRIGPMATLLLAAAACWVFARPAAPAIGAEDSRAPALPTALLLALLAAGLLSVLVSLAQVFAPGMADGVFIARPTTPGRAIGNLRQPNQLSTVLLWACAAAVWLAALRRWPPALCGAALAALVFALVLTASRTGTVGVLLLGLWGVLDRRLPRALRVLLVAAPVFYGLAWWGLSAWSAHGGAAFFGTAQVEKTVHGDASSSRVGIWLNTLSMIVQHPWAGVGFGGYNFAWAMTPFPGRPVAFFDHSHNLVLQLLAEFGVPLGLLIMGCTGWALWRGRSALVDRDDARAISARTALFMLALVGVHSLLEYPLWYAYFLLPAAAVAGWYLGLSRAQPTVPPEPAALPAAAARGMAVAAMLAMFAGAMWASVEYWRVAQVFETKLAWGEAAPLDQRIARGRRSVLFGHHADYARATMAERPEEVFDSFARPLYHLLDTRLMTAYAKALAARGEVDKARHVAARLREFRRPESDEFFAVCASDAAAFQCGADPKLPYQALRP